MPFARYHARNVPEAAAAPAATPPLVLSIVFSFCLCHQQCGCRRTPPANPLAATPLAANPPAIALLAAEAKVIETDDLDDNADAEGGLIPIRLKVGNIWEQLIKLPCNHLLKMPERSSLSISPMLPS